MAVGAPLAIGQVVLALVGGQVGQREAVVRGDHVDAGQRRAPTRLEHRAGSRQRLREAARRAAVAQPPGPHRVAVAVVPFVPARAEFAQAVTAVTDVPGLGDQLASGQQRVLRDGREQRGPRREGPPRACVIAPERGGEVEAKTVHAEGLNPPAQAVHHKLNGSRVRQVQRVAAAAGVAQRARSIVRVVVRLVEPAPGEHGALRIALGGVVVDHVEHHLQARAVQRVHHGAELVAHAGVVGGRGPVHRQARVGHEVRERVVTPMVAQAFFQQVALGDAALHRQQAQRGDAQAPEMRQHGGAGQTREAAALASLDARVQGGERLDLRLIEHGARHGHPRPGREGFAGGPFARPVQHARLGHARGVVPVGRAAFERERIHRPAQGARPGVDEQALGLKIWPQALCAQTVALAGRQARREAVPDAVGAGGQRQTRCFHAIGRVEQAQLDTGGPGCPHRQVDAGQAVLDGRRRAQRPGTARPHAPSRQGASHSTDSGGRPRRSRQG